MKQTTESQIIEVLEIGLSSGESKAIQLNKAEAILYNRGLRLSRSTIEKFWDVLDEQTTKRFLDYCDSFLGASQ